MEYNMYYLSKIYGVKNLLDLRYDKMDMSLNKL